MHQAFQPGNGGQTDLRALIKTREQMNTGLNPEALINRLKNQEENLEIYLERLNKDTLEAKVKLVVIRDILKTLEDSYQKPDPAFTWEPTSYQYTHGLPDLFFKEAIQVRSMAFEAHEKMPQNKLGWSDIQNLWEDGMLYVKCDSKTNLFK